MQLEADVEPPDDDPNRVGPRCLLENEELGSRCYRHRDHLPDDPWHYCMTNADPPKHPGTHWRWRTDL